MLSKPLDIPHYFTLSQELHESFLDSRLPSHGCRVIKREVVQAQRMGLTQWLYPYASVLLPTWHFEP